MYIWLTTVYVGNFTDKGVREIEGVFNYGVAKSLTPLGLPFT